MKQSILRGMLGLSLILFTSATTFAQGLKVTLLGTGSPIPLVERFGPSTLVEAGTEKLLFDCGRGVPIRLWQLKVPLHEVSAVFFTHLHSDHVVGFPDLWLTGWLPPPFGQRSTPLQVYGPIGTQDMMLNLRKAYAADIRIRIADEKVPPQGAAILAHEITEGVVYERNGVKVTAFDVDHGALIKPAFGYRVDYGGHSVVLSGDTRFSENLIRFSKGTDVLLHEVAVAKPELLKVSRDAQRIIGHHTTPEDAGKVFDRVKPKLAVYTHIVLLTTDPAISAPPIEDVTSLTRKTYSGPLEIGQDLMTIEVGASVQVRRPPSPR